RGSPGLRPARACAPRRGTAGRRHAVTLRLTPAAALPRMEHVSPATWLSTWTPREQGDQRMGAEARLKALRIELPPVPTPLANYVPSVRVGNLLFLAGHGPQKDGKMMSVGKVGRDLSVEEGAQAARLVGLNLLASTRAALGS